MENYYGIIYCATNLINKKVYIGQTTKSLNYRKSTHIRGSRNKRPQCRKFHFAIQKYGHENFEWTVIATCSSQEELNTKEIEFISIFKATEDEFGYNLAQGGRSGGRLSEETKRILSEKSRGEKSVWFGRKHTEETKIKISLAQKGKTGKPHTEASKEKLRQRMMGNSISEEARAKISAKKTGFKHSQASKEKMSAERKKNYLNPEYQQKMKELAVNRGQDIEMRKKIAEAKGAKPFAAYKDGVLIKEFFSIHGAAKELGLSCAGIRKVLKQKSKACRGYVFAYIS